MSASGKLKALIVPARGYTIPDDEIQYRRDATARAQRDRIVLATLPQIIEAVKALQQVAVCSMGCDMCKEEATEALTALDKVLPDA